MDPYTAYQLLYGAGAASLAGGAGAAAYGTYRAAKGAYNLVGRMRAKRPSPRGNLNSRYMLSKCRKTRVYKRSPLSQKSITAPNSRVVDTKYVDQLNTFTNLKGTAAVTFIIGDIQGGSGEGQRVGNDIRMIKYIVTYQIKHGSESTDQTYRLLLVRSKTSNSATAPALSDILNNDPTVIVSPTSLRNVGSIEDFEILLDKLIYLPNNTGATNHSLKTFTWNVDVCFPQRFSGTGSGTIIRNPVHCFMITNSANTTTGASGHMSTRIIYSDI